tara:strand:+ start:2121 stop:2306 length:186 start_codon:yes stop_codon:yes gene_type:complete
MIKNEWLDFAINNKYNYILILKDLEDKEIYPVYFLSELEMLKYKENIISESKVKVMTYFKV